MLEVACLAFVSTLIRVVSEEFEVVSTLLQGMEAEHLSIFKAIRTCPALIAFFRAKDYHSTDGQAKFDEIRQEITLRLRNNVFKNALFNTVQLAHRVLGPFIVEGASLRSVC